jgi:2-hydroxyacyl-CoA lyase 1
MAHARSTEYVPCVRPPDSPCSLAAQPDVARAAALLRMAKRPLVIIGKGWVLRQPDLILSCANSISNRAQFARAESAVQRLLSVLPIPFIPTPMGKGLIPDDHPLCVAAARSTALAQADVVLILGARLNWILHYGQHPKWNEHAKFIRVEIDPSTIDNNKAAEVNLLGDLNGITNQLAHALESHPCESLQATVHSSGNMSQDHALWYKFLFAKCHENAQKMIEKTMILQTRGQKTDRRGFEPRMTYQQAFNIIRKELPADHIFIGEGANTMDIARSMFDVVLPRSRLDAGTQATMGVGMGYCIAAALDAASYSRSSGRPRRPIVAIIGDSAFGFSAMEVETAVRNRMGMLVIVMNNGGVRVIIRNQSTALTLLRSLGIQRTANGNILKHRRGAVTTNSLTARDRI